MGAPGEGGPAGFQPRTPRPHRAGAPMSTPAPGVTLGATAALWDPLMRLLGYERLILRPILDLARPLPEMRVLDLGCGTGTLLRALAARAGPAGVAAGIDLDPAMITRARRKLPWADLRVGSATRLPWPDRSFDLVTATFVLHHLDRAAKAVALAEARRVLSPGGRIVIADFGPPHGPLGRLTAALIPLDALLAGRSAFLAERRALREGLAGRLPALVRAAGFAVSGTLTAHHLGVTIPFIVGHVALSARAPSGGEGLTPGSRYDIWSPYDAASAAKTPGGMPQAEEDCEKGEAPSPL
jgi:SAM-dependent methyltransferase